MKTKPQIAKISLAACAFATFSSVQITPVQAAPLTPQQALQQKRGRQVTETLTRFLKTRVVSPSNNLTVIVKPGARPDLGYFSEIYVSGRPVQLVKKKKRMQINDITLRARNVRIDVAALMRARKPDIETLSSTTTLRAVVSDSDLTSMLAQGKRTKEMSMRVKYVGDLIQVSGNWNWGWFKGPVVGTGKLRVGADKQVFFDIKSLKLNGAEVPPFMKAKFSDKVNPVISYEDIPFQPKFRALKFSGNKAILTAG